MRPPSLRLLALLAILGLYGSEVSAEENWKTLFSKGSSVFQGKILGKDGDTMVVQVRTINQPEDIETVILNCKNKMSKLVGGSFYDYLIEEHGSDYSLLKWKRFSKKTEDHLCGNYPFRAY